MARAHYEFKCPNCGSPVSVPTEIAFAYNIRVGTIIDPMITIVNGKPLPEGTLSVQIANSCRKTKKCQRLVIMVLAPSMKVPGTKVVKGFFLRAMTNRRGLYASHFEHGLNDLPRTWVSTTVTHIMIESINKLLCKNLEAVNKKWLHKHGYTKT